ncbi:MAG: insulinase family protein, partial [Bacteroidaceae bacterium]|nr:insulinase family protein [Bacteroidaceae bacterium]
WLELSCSAQHSYLSLYSLNKYLPQTVRILESILKEPTFPEKEFQIVMSNNLQEFLVEKDKVTYISRNGLLRALYGENHPQGKNIQVADFTSILPDDLHDFYERYYSSDNFTIFLSGKITPEVEKIVTYSFGYSSFGNSLYKSVDTDFPIMKDTEKRIFINRDDALQSAVYMGNLTISRHHQDFKKLRVLITLFGGYFGSRLMSNIREDKGYTYDISANIISYPDSGMIRISSETSNEYVEPLIREVYHEIDVLQEDLVSDDELIMVRNYMIGNLCRSCESAFSLANLWQFVYTQGLKDSYFNDLLQSIREVTPEELRKLARTYLCKNILKEVVTGKKSS